MHYTRRVAKNSIRQVEEDIQHADTSGLEVCIKQAQYLVDNIPVLIREHGNDVSQWNVRTMGIFSNILYEASNIS